MISIFLPVASVSMKARHNEDDDNVHSKVQYPTNSVTWYLIITTKRGLSKGQPAIYIAPFPLVYLIQRRDALFSAQFPRHSIELYSIDHHLLRCDHIPTTHGPTAQFGFHVENDTIT